MLEHEQLTANQDVLGGPTKSYLGSIATGLKNRWALYVAVLHNASGLPLTKRDIEQLTPPLGNPVLEIEATEEITGD